MHWLLTRPAGCNLALRQALEARGNVVSEMPALAISPWQDVDQIQLWPLLQDFDALLFTSRNAVIHFARTLTTLGLTWPVAAYLAIGKGTAAELTTQGMSAVCPREGYTTEALLALPEVDGLAGRHLLMVTGVGGRGLLMPSLQKRGVTVTRLNVYRRDCDTRSVWPSRPVDGVFVTSLESWHCIQSKAENRLTDCVWVAGNERIAEGMRDRTLNVRVAASPDDDDMLACALQIEAGEMKS